MIRHFIFLVVCGAGAIALQSLGEYRESLPYSSDAKVYVTDIKLPLMPGPMGKPGSDSELEAQVEPSIVADSF